MSDRLRDAVVRLFRPRALHPILTSPLAIRVSQWSLSIILVAYVLVTLVWSAVVAVGIRLLAHPAESGATSAQQAVAAIWGPENLLLKSGQPFAFYALATVNAFVSLLLPLFVLGSFVYKLFGQDPIVWRKRLSIEASPPESHPAGFFVLVARFYNQIRVDATDVHVRAWLRFSTSEYNPTVMLNKRLELLARGQRAEEWVLPLMRPTDVTAVRLVLCPYADSPDPVTDSTIVVQGETIHRATASVVLIAEGTLITLNETFRSAKTYHLSEEIDAEIYQDISLGEPIPQEWANFEGVQWSYVFFYGPIMTSASLRALGIAPGDAAPARLAGWRRTWNTPTTPRPSAGTYLHQDGSPFEGAVVKLGVERCAPDELMPGVVARVDYRALAALDSREPEYVRTDVTHDLKWESDEPVHPFRVFVYAPRQSLLDAFARAENNGSTAVSESYLDSIRAAAWELGLDYLDDVDQAPGLAGVPVVLLAE